MCSKYIQSNNVHSRFNKTLGINVRTVYHDHYVAKPVKVRIAYSTRVLFPRKIATGPGLNIHVTVCHIV